MGLHYKTKHNGDQEYSYSDEELHEAVYIQHLNVGNRRPF